MHKFSLRGLFLFFLFTTAPTISIMAQSTGSGKTVTVALFILLALVFISAVMLVSDNLLGLQARKYGVSDLEKDKQGGFLSMFKDKQPDYVNGSYKNLKKGYDIRLKGEAIKEIRDVAVSTVALQPPNFVGMSPIPKVVVEEGAEVLAGDPIFFDKKRPEINYVSPVSGEIVSINRGLKRAITEVVILVDGEQRFREIPQVDLASISREDLVKFLLDTGAWTLIRQRPFDIVPAPGATPANIFVSTFDTAPLAPDQSFVLQGQEEAFQKGLDILGRLTEGEVHLGLDGRGETAPAAFKDFSATKHYFAGPHPAGNVGVQIHHVSPVNNVDTAWTLGVQEVITLGKLLTERKYDAKRIVALTGDGFSNPHYVRTHQGAKISDLISDQTAGDNLRIISGDVLSGSQKTADQYLDFSGDQITTISEGNEHELFGWLLPFKARPSVSRSFPNFLFPDVPISANTNTHGEERAFVVTGQYESMLPMDVYPQHLMKAILANDFERMEGLGIYELSEEDVALAEFACTSKQPLQHILREGLNYMREQG